MQEIIKFSETTARNIKRRQSTYSAQTVTLLKNKEIRATLCSLFLVFLISCVGVSLFSDVLLSIGGLDEIIVGRLSVYALLVVSFLIDFSVFAFGLFPFALGIYAYALKITQSYDTDTAVIFFYYKNKSKYLFAVRLAYRAIFTLALLFSLSYFSAYFGVMLAEHFLQESDIVRATVLLLLTLACLVALLALAIARIFDYSMIVSLSLNCTCSASEMYRASAMLVKGNKRRVTANCLHALLPVIVAFFSAGLLAPFVLPRAMVSRAFLENDIINEYKIKNNI